MKARIWSAKERGIKITRLMKRDGSDCRLCGLPLNRKIDDDHDPQYITLDHILPLGLGGTDAFDNIQLAHNKCNRDRGMEY